MKHANECNEKRTAPSFAAAKKKRSRYLINPTMVETNHQISEPPDCGRGVPRAVDPGTRSRQGESASAIRRETFFRSAVRRGYGVPLQAPYSHRTENMARVNGV
jgi:hypothetical protein